jgi:hypothetical protein
MFMVSGDFCSCIRILVLQSISNGFLVLWRLKFDSTQNGLGFGKGGAMVPPIFE